MSLPLAQVVERRLQVAAGRLGAADPTPLIRPLLHRTFALPAGDPRYAANTLTPGTAPFEPSFAETEPNLLRFTIEPLGPEASPTARRDDATREVRRLVGGLFGSPALRWFDQRSEEWRGFNHHSELHYGAWFGTATDAEGLHSAKIYYELRPGQIDALPPSLRRLVSAALETMPNLVPVFTSIRCGRESGSQRVTFLHRGPMRLADLHPLLQRLGLGAQLPGIMQIVGLTLGGRFDLPDRTVLLGLRESADGTEIKLEILLGSLPDLPPTFLDLLTLGLSERPRELAALSRWLRAFTPETRHWPGRFSVLSIRATPRSPARVSLYLRPIELEVTRSLEDVDGSPADEMPGDTAHDDVTDENLVQA
jgi:hypothetical protein